MKKSLTMRSVVIYIAVILIVFILAPIAYLNSNSKFTTDLFSAKPFTQSTSLTILGPGNKPQLVVNEGSTTQLMVVDAMGNTDALRYYAERTISLAAAEIASMAEFTGWRSWRFPYEKAEYKIFININPSVSNNRTAAHRRSQFQLSL